MKGSEDGREAAAGPLHPDPLAMLAAPLPEGANVPHRDTASARSRAAAHRLDPEVRPIAYPLALDVDPVRGPDYRGEDEIRVGLGGARRRIELQSADRELGRARVESDEGAQAARARLDPARQIATLELARPVGPGEAVLRIPFAGRVRDDLRGLYVASAGGRPYAFTQLEAADARRFFPCFD